MQALPVASCQQIRLAVAPATPDGTHGVDDPGGWQLMAARDLGLPRLASGEQPAFVQKLRTGGPMDRAIDPAAAELGRVGGVDDGVHGQRCDVGAQRAYQQVLHLDPIVRR